MTDTVFSMDGDSAPLAAIAALARRYNAWLRVDEAHALKAELLDNRAGRERSFVAHNILASAAVLEREGGSAT